MNQTKNDCGCLNRTFEGVSLRHLRKLAPILLSILVLFQSMTGALLVANYQIQKQQIAKTLCESRSNPSKGCEGKCYLKKQLKKAENAENSLPGSIKEKMEATYTLQSAFQFIFCTTNTTLKHFSFYTFFLPDQPYFLEPHPPCV